MPCPKCGSNDLWDDNLAWGCNKCDWMSSDGSVRNVTADRDIFNRNTSDEWKGKNYGKPYHISR